MKKIITIVCVIAMLAAFSPMTASALTKRDPGGGIGAFFAGCCLGIRTGLAYNDGAQIHIREWGTLIPYAGIVFSVLNGIDCYNGMTTKEFAEKRGASWY